ncbi:Gpx7, partial [Symbiodinium sp. KB8]
MQPVLAAAGAVGAMALLGSVAAEPSEKTLYDFSLPAGPGEPDIQLASLKPYDVVLVVNTASECGLTDINFKELQQLQDKFA